MNDTERGEPLPFCCCRQCIRDRGDVRFGLPREVTEFVARHMLIACEICEEPVAPTFSDSDEDPDNFVPVDVCAGFDLADK